MNIIICYVAIADVGEQWYITVWISFQSFSLEYDTKAVPVLRRGIIQTINP